VPCGINADDDDWSEYCWRSFEEIIIVKNRSGYTNSMLKTHEERWRRREDRVLANRWPFQTLNIVLSGYTTSMRKLGVIHTYHSCLIPESRVISDIPLRRPRLTKMIQIWGILQTWKVVCPRCLIAVYLRMLLIFWSPFMTSMEGRERSYSIVLSVTGLEIGSDAILFNNIIRL
jgi:hypothetical protein